MHEGGFAVSIAVEGLTASPNLPPSSPLASRAMASPDVCTDIPADACTNVIADVLTDGITDYQMELNAFWHYRVCRIPFDS